MQSGKAPAEFSGRYELTLAGTLDGTALDLRDCRAARKPLQLKQYAARRGHCSSTRPQAVVKTCQVRVIDTSGGVRATADRQAVT